MKEEKIKVIIKADGSIQAETHGLKGKTCEPELAALLEEIAAIHEITPTSEAKEKPTDALVTPSATIGRKQP